MTKQGRHKGIEERIGSDGKVSYRAKVRIKGFPAQGATFARLTDAVRWRQQTETDIRRGKYFQTAEARKHTFGELVDRYIATVLPRKPKSEKKQAAQLLWWREQIGDRLLSEINTALIVEIRDKFGSGITYRRGKRSPATVNRYLAVLSHAFSVAINEWQWLTESPIKRLKQKESSGRIRFLSDAERDRLLQACKESKNKYLYLVVLIALSTGLRLNEIIGIRHSCIRWDKENCIITIPANTSKNGHEHCIPLVGIAKHLLAEHSKIRRLDTDLVFPATKGFKPRPAVIRTAWEEALRKADIREFSFHCLRHTAASWLAQANTSGPIIQKILNHRSSNITARYIHFAENHLQDALEKMNDAFLAREINKNEF
jgi:integrase